jgi:hypothetical protein
MPTALPKQSELYAASVVFSSQVRSSLLVLQIVLQNAVIHNQLNKQVVPALELNPGFGDQQSVGY